MQSDWTQVKFNEAIQIIGGGTPKTSEPAYWNGLIPWLSVVDFNGVPRWVSKTEKNITQLGLEKSSTKLLNEGDIVISARGTVGALAQLSHPMSFNQSCYGIRGISNVSDTNFIFYALKFAVNSLKQLAHGGVFDTITRDTFKSIDLLLPPLREQKRIAELLGVLDDRITLLLEANKILESIALAIFKSWFTDFDPVRAKMEGRTPTGMDEETAALFSDELVECEFGVVPKGWSYTTVGSAFILTMGQSPPGDTYNLSGQGIPFYQGRTDFGFRFPSQRVFCSAPTRIAEIDDTLVSVRAPVGDVNMAIERCCLGRGVASVRHPNGYRSFTFYSMRNLGYRFKTFDGEGTVFGSINKKDFESLSIVMPSDQVLQKYNEISVALDQKIFINELSLRTLSEIRDILLPRLISGKLRLKDVDCSALQ